MFPLGFGFGTQSLDTDIEYRLINSNVYWVDDSQSPYYNQWVESSTVSWNSAEHMIDYPVQYHYGVVIDYNVDPVVPNAGSAIFLHCISGSYTSGCVAIPENDMINVLKWLRSDSKPMIIIS